MHIRQLPARAAELFVDVAQAAVAEFAQSNHVGVGVPRLQLAQQRQHAGIHDSQHLALAVLPARLHYDFVDVRNVLLVGIGRILGLGHRMLVSAHRQLDTQATEFGVVVRPQRDNQRIKVADCELQPRERRLDAVRRKEPPRKHVAQHVGIASLHHAVAVHVCRAVGVVAGIVGQYAQRPPVKIDVAACTPHLHAPRRTEHDHVAFRAQFRVVGQQGDTRNVVGVADMLVRGNNATRRAYRACAQVAYVVCRDEPGTRRRYPGATARRRDVGRDRLQLVFQQLAHLFQPVREQARGC